MILAHQLHYFETQTVHHLKVLQDNEALGIPFHEIVSEYLAQC